MNAAAGVRGSVEGDRRMLHNMREMIKTAADNVLDVSVKPRL